ncbi:MAG: tetratricopeptide repeat protein [bacterium]
MFEFILGKDVKKIIEKAHELENSGEEKKALSLLEKEAKNKEEYSLYLELGRLQAKMNLGTAAQRNLSNAHMLAPENIANTLERAEDGYFLGGRDPEVAVFLGETHLEQGNVEKAIEYFQEIPKENLEKEIKTKQSHLKNFPPDTANKAKRLNLCQSIAVITVFIDQESAIHLLENLYQEFPQTKELIDNTLGWMSRNDYRTPFPHIHYGSFLTKTDQPEKAIDFFNKAINIDRKSTEKIIAILEQRKSHRPEMVDFLFKLYTLTNQPEQALELIQNADLPSEKVARYYREIIKGDKKNLEARKNYTENLLKEKKYSEAALELDFFSDQQNYFPWVQEKIDQILVEPNDKALFIGAEINIKQDNLEKAIDYLNSLLSNYPSSTESIEMLVLDIVKNNPDFHPALILLIKVLIEKREQILCLMLFEYMIFSGSSPLIDAAKQLFKEYGKNLKADFQWLTVSYMISLISGSETRSKIINQMVEKFPDQLDEFIVKIDLLSDIYKEVIPAVNQDIMFLLAKHPSEVCYVTTIFSSIKVNSPQEAIKILQEYKSQFPSNKFSRKLLSDITQNFPDDPEVLKTNIIDNLKQKKINSSLEYLRTLINYPKQDTWVIELFKRLNKSYPKNYQVHFTYLEFLLKRKLYSKLITEVDKAMEVVPSQDKSYLHYIKGQALLENDKFEEGIICLANSIETSSQYAQQVIDSLLKAEEFYDHPKIKYVLIKAYAKKKEYQQAAINLFSLKDHPKIKKSRIISEFKVLLKDAPTDSYLRFYLGKILNITGSIDEAVTEFQLAATYNQELAEPAFQEVQQISKQIHSPEVLQAMGILAEHCKRYDVFYKTFSSLFKQKANQKKILHYITEKIEQNPQQAIYKIIFSKFQILTGNPDQGLTTALSIGDLDNLEHPTYANLISELIEKYPENPELWIRQGKIQMISAQPEQGINSYLNAFKLNPDFSDQILDDLKNIEDLSASFLAIRIHLKKNNFDQAKQILEEHIEKFSEDHIQTLTDDIIKAPLNEDSLSLYILLVDLLSKLDKYEEVIKIVKNIEKYPFEPALREKIYSNMIHAAVKIDKNIAAEYLAKFKILVGHQKFIQWILEQRENQIKQLSVKFTESQSDPLIYYNLAVKFIEMNYLDQADQILTKILKNNLTSEQFDQEKIWFEKCRIKVLQRNYHQAYFLIKQRMDYNIKNDHWSSKYFKLLLNLQMATSDYRGALSTYKVAFSHLSPKEQNIYYDIVSRAFGDNALMIINKKQSVNKLINQNLIKNIMESL